MNVLTAGESSRLHRRLVEEEGVALAVNSYWSSWLDPGLVVLLFTLPPGGDPDDVERRVMEELQQIAAEGVTEAEFQKARNIVVADIWRELSTIRGKADAVGEYEVFHGNYEALFRVPARIEVIAAKELQNTAAGVFRANNMTVGVLRPPEEPGE
jgi:zinc protease